MGIPVSMKIANLGISFVLLLSALNPAWADPRPVQLQAPSANPRVRQILQVKEDMQRQYPHFHDLYETLANREITAEFFPNNLRQIPLMITVVGGAGVGKSVGIPEFYRRIGKGDRVIQKQISEGQTEVPVDAITEFAVPGLTPVAGAGGVVILDEGHHLQTEAGADFKRSMQSHRLPVYGHGDVPIEELSEKMVFETDFIEDQKTRTALAAQARRIHDRLRRQNGTTKARSALDILWSLLGMSVFQTEPSASAPGGLEKLRALLSESLGQIEGLVAAMPTQPSEYFSQLAAEAGKLEVLYRELLGMYIQHLPLMDTTTVSRTIGFRNATANYYSRPNLPWWEVAQRFRNSLNRTSELWNKEYGGTEAPNDIGADPNIPARVAQERFNLKDFPKEQKERVIDLVRQILDSIQIVRNIPNMHSLAEEIAGMQKKIGELDLSTLLTEVHSNPVMYGEMKRLAAEAKFPRSPGHYFLKLLQDDPIGLAQIMERIYSQRPQPYNAYGTTVIILANDLDLNQSLDGQTFATPDARREAAIRNLREYPVRQRVLDILYGMFGRPSNPEAFESRMGEVFYYPPASDEQWVTKMNSLLSEKVRELEVVAEQHGVHISVQISPAVSTRLAEVIVQSDSTTRALLARLVQAATPAFVLVDTLESSGINEGQTSAQRHITLGLSSDGEHLEFRQAGIAEPLASIAVERFRDPTANQLLRSVTPQLTNRRNLVWAATKTVVGALFTSSVPNFSLVTEESSRFDRWWNIPNDRTLEHKFLRATLSLVTCAAETVYLGGQDPSPQCERDRDIARHHMAEALDILKHRSRTENGSDQIDLSRQRLPENIARLAQLTSIGSADINVSVDRLSELVYYLVIISDPAIRQVLARYETSGVQISANDLKKAMRAGLPPRMATDLGEGFWRALGSNAPGTVADIQQTQFGAYSQFQDAKPGLLNSLFTRIARSFRRTTSQENAAFSQLRPNLVRHSECLQFLTRAPKILRANPLPSRAD